MTVERKTGTACVEAARKLAKAHGIDVLGWNDKPGREFISLNGDGDKLQSLRKEMEKDGWYAWPVDEAQEGHFMDFGMNPPPQQSKIKSAAKKDKPGSIRALESFELSIPAFTENKFRYDGPISLFRNNLLFLSLLPIAAIWLNRNEPANWDVGFKIGLSVGAFAVVAAFLLPFHWIAVHADEVKLTIRKHFFGKIKEIPLAEIAKVKIFSETDRKGYKTRFIGFNLKSGKAFDLFLPKQKQVELYAFLRSKTRLNA